MVKSHCVVELTQAAALAIINIFNGGMRLAESAARRARDHAVDEAGLPAGFSPPCWRNIIAVVDDDARVRRTQALLNLSGTRELLMACWLLG